MIRSGAGKRYAASADIEADGLPSDFARHSLNNFSANGGTVGLCSPVGGTIVSRTNVDGQLAGTAMLIPFKCVLYGIDMLTISCPTAITTDNVQKVGLYSSDGTDLTLRASSADLGSAFYSLSDGTGASNVHRMVPFSSTYTITTPGVYWVALLTNWSSITGTSSLGGVPNTTSGAAQPLCTTNVKRFWTVASQTDLPSTQTWAGTSNANSSPNFIAVGKSS